MTEEELQKILKEYQEELADLEKRRKEKALRRANMTEEELIQDLADEYKAVYEDAVKEGMPIVVVGEDEE